MRTKILILCCALFFMISCQKDDENTDPIIGSWDLIQKSGGLVAAENYNPGDIVWTFSEDNLSVEDNLTNNNETSGYSLVEYNDSLFISGSPITSGLIYLEISDDEMIINQNIELIIMGNDTMPAPLLADAFTYSFEKQ